MKLLNLLLVFQLGAGNVLWAKPLEENLLFTAAEQFNSYKTWEQLPQKMPMTSGDQKFILDVIKQNKLKGALPYAGKSSPYILLDGHKMFIYPASFGAVVRIDGKFVPFYKHLGLRWNFENFGKALEPKSAANAHSSVFALAEALFAPPHANALPIIVIPIVLGILLIVNAYAGPKIEQVDTKLSNLPQDRSVDRLLSIGKVKCPEGKGPIEVETMHPMLNPEALSATVEKCQKDVNRDYAKLSETKKYELNQTCILMELKNPNARTEYGTISKLEYSAEPLQVREQLYMDGKWSENPSGTRKINLDGNSKTYYVEAALIFLDHPFDFSKIDQDTLQATGERADGIVYSMLKGYCNKEPKAMELLNKVIEQNKRLFDLYVPRGTDDAQAPPATSERAPPK